jgi:hypothetical protein
MKKLNKKQIQQARKDIGLSGRKSGTSSNIKKDLPSEPLLTEKELEEWQQYLRSTDVEKIPLKKFLEIQRRTPWKPER